MFFQLLFIHLFRPFLKYNQTSSPLPANVSPRKMCTHAATMISKLLRLYRRNYGLRQICNIAVYICHSACTIHLLNLPDKNARRDIVHGLKHLEEIAEGWLVARRTLNILSILVRRWRIEIPEEAVAVLSRTDLKYTRHHSASDYLTPTSASPSISSPIQELALDFRQPTNGHYRALDQNTMPPSIPSKISGPRSGPVVANRNRMYTSPQQSESFIPPAAPVQMPPSQPVNQVPSTWSTDNANGVPPNPDREEQTSPSMLFTGEHSNIESQDWWLQDQHTLASGFNNWVTFNSEDLRMMEDNLDSAFNGMDGSADWGQFG